MRQVPREGASARANANQGVSALRKAAAAIDNAHEQHKYELSHDD